MVIREGIHFSGIPIQSQTTKHNPIWHSLLDASKHQVIVRPSGRRSVRHASAKIVQNGKRWLPNSITNIPKNTFFFIPIIIFIHWSVPSFVHHLLKKQVWQADNDASIRWRTGRRTNKRTNGWTKWLTDRQTDKRTHWQSPYTLHI